MLIMENVATLVSEDYLHHIVTDISAYLQEKAMVAVGVWNLSDGALGGPTSRKRNFLIWEQVDMASRLPPLEAEPASVPSQPAYNVLDSPGEVFPLLVGGRSEHVKLECPKQLHSGATQVGNMMLCGPEGRWMLGRASSSGATLGHGECSK